MSHSDKSDVRTINWENQLEGVTAVISFHLTEYICWFITHICKMQGPHCLKMWNIFLAFNKKKIPNICFSMLLIAGFGV